MDVSTLSSLTLSAAPEDFDENDDWGATGIWNIPASEYIEEDFAKWDPPGHKHGSSLYDILVGNDAAALEDYLQNFHARREMPSVRSYPTPWHIAVQHGNLEVLRVLMKYADYDYSYGREWEERQPGGAWDYCPDLGYLFLAACRSRSMPVMRLLLEWPGTDVRQRAPDGKTPLLQACEALCDRPAGDAVSLEEHVSRCEGIIELLLDSGADANDQLVQRGVVIGTPLSFAVTLGTPGLIRRLIDQGADVNVRVRFEENCVVWEEDEYYDGIGNSTPLHIATRHLNVEAVRVLVE